ncbi:MAG: hypothetical protein M3O02_09935 [Acidobacteriota bacterium]|nr:hypothetical protein [Acidobacteriota bacterium]
MTTLDLIRQLVSRPRDAVVVLRDGDGHFSAIGSVAGGELLLEPSDGQQATKAVILEERPLFELV